MRWFGSAKKAARLAMVLGRLGNSVLDVSQKVGLGAARPHAGRYHPPGGDFQVGDQAQGAMAVIVMLNAGHLTHPHRLGGVFMLQGLNTRLLIGRHPMNPKLMELSGLTIECTNSAHLGLKDGLVLRLSIEPVATQVRLDLRFLNHRLTVLRAIVFTIPRLTTSAANSREPQRVIGRPECCGGSPATAISLTICSGLKVAGLPGR